MKRGRGRGCRGPSMRVRVVIRSTAEAISMRVRVVVRSGGEEAGAGGEKWARRQVQGARNRQGGRCRGREMGEEGTGSGLEGPR